MVNQFAIVSKKPDEEEEDENEMDSEEEVNKEHKRCHRRGKNGGLPPRKAIKKLIFKELETQAPTIFE